MRTDTPVGTIRRVSVFATFSQQTSEQTSIIDQKFDPVWLAIGGITVSRGMVCCKEQCKF